MEPGLRYIRSGAADGFKNMAIDELFLEECKRGLLDAVLRVYQWAPPAISVGYTQSTNLIDLTSCEEAGVDLVRRITGGGAVLHWEEITYCLVVRREALPALKWPRQFARLMGTALCLALRSLGIEASLSPGSSRREVAEIGEPAANINSMQGVTLRGTDRANLSDVKRASFGTTRSSHDAQSSLCFSSGTENEVSVLGRKLAGCAHKFTKEAFFSHGSIMTGPAHLRIVDLLRPEAGTIKKSDLREKSTCLSDLLSVVPRLEAVGYELKQRVETTFGLSLAEGELAGDEETLANERALAERRNTSAMEHAVSKRSDSNVPGRMLASARFLK